MKDRIIEDLFCVCLRNYIPEEYSKRIIRNTWTMISLWLQQVGGTHRQTAYTKKYEIALGLGHWIILKCYDLISLTHNSTVFASHTLFLEVFQTISSGVKEWPVGSTVVGIWAQARFSMAVSDSADLW